MSLTAPDHPVLSLETPFDAAAVERVVDAAFGSGRFAKTAERLREGSKPLVGFVARSGREVIGSVRLWPIQVGKAEAAFLGPIAIDEELRRAGTGALLVQACLEWAREQRMAGVLLVGDLPYFGRFGFEPASDAILPGPVDQRRVLWLSLDGSVADGVVVRR